ncbi:MAG TPA: NAD-dependent epimerase/dehydratase family protein [Burkholderiaceae bacterium]|jgi:dTDP-L-rhamnose 4-epimerase
MKILITGGAGFIGSWLTERLCANGHEVTILDNLSAQIHGEVPSLDIGSTKAIEKAKFIRADVRDVAAMDAALASAEAIVHLAAETGTGQSMYRIAHYYDVNQQATAAMFEAIGTRHRHVRKVVLASSRSIYGEGAYKLNDAMIVPAPRDSGRLQAGHFDPVGPNGEALHLIATPEDASPMPASMYAGTKLANEVTGRIFAESYGVQVTALRFQNVYGERQSLRNPYTGILSIFSNRMRQNLPINIFEDGAESRDFVHVSDVVDSIERALLRDSPGWLVANVGSGVATSVLKVAEELKQLLGSGSDLSISGDFRVGDIRHCFANIDRAQALLRFEPKVDLREGLARFVRWVLTQPILEDQSQKAQTELARLGLGRGEG